MYEDMIATNPKYAQVAAFGNWGSAEDAVYSNWEEKDFDIPSIKARDDLKFVFGLDFGFSVSYNAFVAAAIEPMTKTMWIYDELYFKGKTNVDIAKTIIAAGYGREEIWADCQEGKSIKELQDGFIEMHDEGNGIEVPTRYILPRIRAAIKGPDSVRVGIAKVNEFHIFVHPSCVNMITEFTNYSYSRDKDGRLTDKPEKDYDHLCLVGDTMILTESGQVPLRDIRPGVQVQSHLGLRKVMAWAKTGENVPVLTLRLSDGTELTGTPDHPIVTIEGDKCLKDISKGDRVIQWVEPANIPGKQYGSMDLNGTGSSMLQIRTPDYTITEGVQNYIDMSGKNTMDQFQKDTTSITSTEIQETTISQTSCSSHQPNTERCIPLQKRKLRSVLPASLNSRIRPRCGTPRPKGTNGTSNMLEIISGQSGISNVNNVERSSKLKTTDTIDSVPMLASQNGAETPASITRSEFVQSVVKNSQSADTPRQGPVLVSVEDVWSSGTADVYSIEVEEAHDYYANHILSVNCDALRYAITGEFQRGHGAVVEARGGAFGHPRLGATTTPDDEPVNTFKHVPYVDATGPADAAPPRKKCVRVFSSVKYDDNGYSDIMYDRPWRGF